jgi:hypothetical protein
MKITIYLHEKELYNFKKLYDLKKILKENKNMSVEEDFIIEEIDNKVIKYTLKQKNSFSAAVTIDYEDFLNLTESGKLKRKTL